MTRRIGIQARIDAIGDEATELRGFFRQHGFPSDIYCLSRDRGLEGESRLFADYPRPDAGDLVILHFALGNIVAGTTGGMIMSMYDRLGILDKMPPEALEQMQEGFKSQALSALAIIPPFIIDPLFGLIGGLIGGSVYKSKGPAAQPPATV